MPSERPVARLALADGTVFTGRAFGACADPLTSTGEVVFNTAMAGYQEALSDPSYSGQILTMTAPMIGNYGVNEDDIESTGPRVAGFVVRELSRVRSNYRSTRDLHEWLAEHGVLGIEGIDTRALVRRLRTEGAMSGVISCDAGRSAADLVELARSTAPMSGQNLAACVSPDAKTAWSGDLGAWRSSPQPPSDRQWRVLALDCGAKRNIYRHMEDLGCRIEAAPWNLTADEILAAEPDGLFVSNGPGDPAAVASTVEVLRAVAGRIPTFGICLGHQLLALSLGATTFKLKFGHRGANQPVRNLLTGRVEITSQNHGFCVDADSLEAAGAEMTHIHLNDHTLAGFRHRERPVFSVQYHPEASPGPHDSAYLFDCFVDVMRTREPVTAEQMERAQARRGTVAVG